MLLPLPLFLYVAFLAVFADVATALRNITVDDNDAMISYQGTWESSSLHRSGLDYGGGHTVSSDVAATATFTFIGVAVYYLAPRWPYPVSTRLALDSGLPISVNLTDPNSSTTPSGGSESAQSSVAWAATGLRNTTHTVVLTLAPGPGGLIIVDGFIYTINDGIDIVSAVKSATVDASSSSPSSFSVLHTNSPKKTNTTAIALAAALGAGAFVCALLLAVFLFARRRKQRRNKSNVLDQWGADQPPLVPFTAAPSMSDASTGPLLASTPSQYHDSTPSESDASSVVGYGYARPSKATYDGEVTDEENDAEKVASGSIARVASAQGSNTSVSEKSRPLRLVDDTPAPPAYSES